MKLEDLLGLAIPVAFFAFWGLEVLVNRNGGGRSFPKVRGWFWVGIGFFLVSMVISVTLPLWLPPDWLAAHRLMDLTGLGLWGAPLAFILLSFEAYWFHRLEHRLTPLWRGLHQMHHSIERVDMPGWAVGHPIETVVFATISTVLATLVLGVDPLAVVVAVTAGGVLNMFEHVNIPTPHWLGYVIQRPEQHCLHHERDVHARNYGGDIVLWDMLFGSYQNDRGFDGKVGFGQSSVRALPAMFAFADVNVQRSTQQ
jgi:sterol desaturase/sphingolipid hydroxylase (fatty acid hydroxylase superfamily)